MTSSFPRFESLVCAAVAACVLLSATPASAYTTRVHIVIANEIRAELITSNDGTVQLVMGDYAVVLSQADADAIVDYPFAFRAGAIGPDNLIFPAMTEPSHGLHMRPYDQCETLYEMAITPEEKAYAMGCFLHGATDAIAHHFVNYFTGETFTLTPLSAGRLEGFDNVIRHIVTESMIQHSILELDPTRFESSAMQHTLPQGFILRAYLDEDSELWQHMSEHARAKLDAARAANPDATLPELVLSANLPPADQLVLLPMYLSEIDQLVVDLRASIEADIVEMQADPELDIVAGDDGVLGTYDDETDCAATCPVKYATYFTYVGLLATRYDGDGDPLPPAFDVVSDKLRSDLYLFLPAYVETVQQISSILNGPLALDSDGLDLDVNQLDTVFAPMRDWVDQITTIDYQTLVQSIVPQWILQLEALLDSVGVNVSVASIVQVLFQPVIDEIEATVEEHVVAEARAYLDELIPQYRAQFDAVHDEVQARLMAAAPVGLTGTALNHWFDSGIWAHSVNIAAAALANHEIVLPAGDELGGFGPASFDSSYTPTWMQPGVCGYLREPIFPMGTDMRGLLSARIDGVDYMATTDDDSPLECHDGSLTSFTSSPTPDNCVLVGLDDLVATPTGSLTRSFPPATISRAVACRNLEVPGLPGPPASDAGPGGDSDAGDPGAETPGGGCCSTSGGGGTAGWVLLVVGVGLLLMRRRRRFCAPASIAMMCLLAVACGGGDDDATTADASVSTHDGAPGDLDSGPGDIDAGSDARAELLAALGSSVWHGTHTRDNIERGYELHFRANQLMWAEIRNPYGPARHREMRAFNVEDDGVSASSTVIVPGDWPPNPDNGRMDDWQIEVIDGNPRTLRLTRDGATEEFTEGPWPAPETGLTAIVYAFAPDMGIDNAFCNSGSGGFEYSVLFGGARGTSGETLIGMDVVAGAPLMRWQGGNNFAVTDVDGFDRLGGTNLSQQSNFVVRYIGDLEHSGGALAMREQDDSVEDGVWVFLDDDVGSDSTADLFLEVHGFVWPENTPDLPTATFPAGDVPIEAILYRCTEALEPVDVEVSFGNGFQLVGEAPSSPLITDELFPPAF